LKPVSSFRIDKRLLDEVKKTGIDIPKFFEASLAKLLKEKKCPYCGVYKKHKWEKIL